MKKAGIIGNLGTDKIGGQTTKTKELQKAMYERYKDIEVMDVYAAKQNIFILLKDLLRVMARCENIAVVLASPGYFKLLPFLSAANIFFRRNLYEFVIGGIRYEYLENQEFRIRMEKRIKKIYVESRYMEGEYKNKDIYNVEYLPNFKSIKAIDTAEIEVCPKGNIRLCTFSRIDRHKGIDEAVSIVKRINNKNQVATLDIIGPVDKEYEAEFAELGRSFDANIRYAGKINSNEALMTLKKYDALLFPTKWRAEGFPGSFIDAMAAGLPILASNLANFRDIVKDGYNGYLIEAQNQDAYMTRIYEWYSNREALYEMKKNAVREVRKYTTESALETFWKEIEGGADEKDSILYRP